MTTNRLRPAALRPGEPVEPCELLALARGILWNPRWPWHAAKALGAGVAVPPQYLRAAPRWN